MLFSTSFLNELFPENKGAVHINLSFHEVATDSRKKTKKSLFVPLVGDNFDGHDFLKDAFNNGAVGALWQKDKSLPRFLPTDFPVYFVEDTLEALQRLASQYRLEINPKVIGITGSNGKTTTKDMVGTVLTSAYNTHRTKGNFNNHIGLPLTILSMPRDTEVLVLEMGMSDFGEIQKLSEIAKPDYAIITNIGESHIEYLGSREGIAQAKTEIVAGMASEGRLYIDGDEPLLKNLDSTSLTVISCGFGPNNSIVLDAITMDSDYTDFQIAGEAFRLPMLGKHNVKNASFAISIAKDLDVSMEQIKKSLLSLKISGMRFEKLQGLNGSTLINDAYNASPTSMKAAIEVITELAQYEKKILVLGDIFEIGETSKPLHRSVAEAITDDIDMVLTMGKDASEITDQVQIEFPKTYAKHCTTEEEVLKELQPVLQEGTIILFKASRGMKFEKMVEQLQE
ncbi:UDP-N-acetylmuramoyl-tripeptide--D-alanyl-D-alanine ligase [Radiobacillus kanasensis]|uniref:UDP-N-acetylmuramoyl-tripeptide--D-alanyl-D- alanine ligase n=1 Tax=Radiobacillus kanasensis TaxID=2844358 RepID=UPI001E2AB9C8|nr:UDP-N-acetylmuramoyl-tripeptide--D-alanyl-D-alanine ligase [Radiobacillus kanasensis]UFU00939.1 UDP-N-acetylmuramoyl-tripeptide--D-alanyl-D-alanine ligase [Radiobacillus kanasensis]